MSLEKPVLITAADLKEVAREAADRAVRKAQEAGIGSAAAAGCAQPACTPIVRMTVITVLQELGLADDQGHIGGARDDIVDLRDLMQTLRMVKRRVRALIIVIIFALLTPLIISHLKGWL